MATGKIGDRRMKYYKFTKKDRRGTHQTGYQYPTPGEWTAPVRPALCEAGYHVCNAKHLLGWRDECLWEVEVKGESVRGYHKSVFEQIRLVRQIETWNPKNLRLYAADVAEDVLEFFESQYPDDDRPRRAILAARDYVNGLISGEQLSAAARSAAYAAADTAARAAAYAAAYDAASATYSAYAAAYDAASATYSAYSAYVVYTKEQALSKYNRWLLERLGIEE
jgi:hypothetical protein